jgi:hypothetical protein
MKKLKITGLVVLLIFIGVFSFFYWGTYSEGARSGVIMKISKRGTVFKTYEGQLNLQGFGATNSNNQFSEVWEFSVIGDASLVEKLKEASLAGERVELEYIERYKAFPWRGDTKYFVTRVKMKE